jgi:hypothetical protein
MMFTMLTQLAMLAIPSPIGIAAGLLMGRSAFADERRRATEKRRAAAKTAVRKFMDEFTLQVGKDSRDTIRRAQREMRDRYAERADELQRSAAEAVAAAQLAARTGEDVADELRRLENDLQMFATLRARSEQLLARSTRSEASR